MTSPGSEALDYARRASEAATALCELLNAPPEGVFVRVTHRELDVADVRGPQRVTHHLSVQCYGRLPQFLMPQGETPE